MITKAFQARVICDDECRAKLWQLTDTFNDRVRFLLGKMLHMRSGRAGPDLKAVFEAIGGSQNAIAKMEAIGGKNWGTRKLDSPDAIAFARIRDTLKQTIQGIGGWIDTHPMEWREHVRQDPSLLRWRKPDVIFDDLTPDELARIDKRRNPGPTRKKPKATQVSKKRADWRATAAALLKKKNPELAGLDRTMREAEWAEQAQSARLQPIRLFDKERDLAGLANEFKRKVYEGAFAVIASYDEKLQDWRKRHAEWSKQKRQFEKDNRDYLAVRPAFDRFERDAGGVTGKRRRRWHRYLRFLTASPALAGWRGKETTVNPIPARARERVRTARPGKRSSIEAEEFFEANPELKALDDVHGRYEEEFVRRSVDRKFLDGFAHPPTLTLPDVRLHPCWYTFKKSASYSELGWEKRGRKIEGSVRVMLPFEKGHRKYDRMAIRFRGTPRLSALRRASSDKVIVDGTGKSAKKYAWRYFDPHDPEADGRPAEVKGIKLMFRPAAPNGTPYLVFTVALRDKELSEKARLLKSSKTIPEGLVTCAADLIMRHPHLAAVSIAVATKDDKGDVYPRIVRTGFVMSADTEQSGKHIGRIARGPSLRHQLNHKRQLRFLRRGSRAAKGSTRNREFQEHVTKMGEDGSRRTARKLVDFALSAYPAARADTLILENLKALRADARRERGLNTGLINWRRGHTTKWAKLFAETSGLFFREEKAYWTSQLCSRCLQLGRRYTPYRNKETRKLEPRFGTVEKLFACPTPGCQIDVNADLNASVNLHRRFYGGLPNVKKNGDAILIDGRTTTYQAIEHDVLHRLRAEAKWLAHAPNAELDTYERAADALF